MSIIEDIKTKMKNALEHFKMELRNIRTGRSNPGMVEHLLVEIYGSSVPLRTVASISAPDAKQLLITPFNPKDVSAISKAIEKANIGFTPYVDGNAVRIKIPPMTQETRKKMVDICRHEKENAKIAMRNLRRDANNQAKRAKDEGVMAEDQFKKMEKEIQKLTDEHCVEIDKTSEKKEQEISTI